MTMMHGWTGGNVVRSGHSSTLLPDNRILLFGGIDNDGKFYNDSHIFDLAHLDSFSLSGSIIRGAPPKPRAYHRYLNPFRTPS
jgi:hypothetical protein